MAHLHDIRLKKKFGQHFLRDHQIPLHMLDAVTINKQTNIFEIGGGDGFLTTKILMTECAKLWVFEIDESWADFLKDTIKDKRLSVFNEDILSIDFTRLQTGAPWTLLANLPYQITFPILHKLQQYRQFIDEGVIMIQEEVAQKIIKKRGRGYGLQSLFFQHYFEWKELDKIPPTAFVPPPKIFSRLLYFKPKKNIEPIPEEPRFWKFIGTCFAQPRRTIKNNFAHAQIDSSHLQPEFANARAQQLSMDQLLNLWKLCRTIYPDK